MVAFLIDGFPSGKREPEGGGINMENVTEEILNGFFCHYEPPTSEQAQFRAAQEARTDPIRYSRRPVAKPILKMSHLHPKHKKQDKSLPKTSSSVQATAGNGTSTASRAGSSGKSVTWRDEQTNQGRTKVEKDVVGCAANYCGLFRQGEGLTDILMSPKEKAAADKAGIPLSADKKTPPTLTAPTPVETPVSSASSKDDSVGSSIKKRLTPILTIRNKKNKTDMDSLAGSAATSVASSAYRPSAGKRILYDDLGNPIEEGDAYSCLEADENDHPLTPAGGASTVADDTPRSTAEGVKDDTVVDTPTAEETGAATMDKHNPLAFFCAVPTALIGSATIAAASAAAAVGYKPTTTETKETDDASVPTTPRPSPSILRRPAPTDRNTGIMAEYRDEIGVYEPMDYDNPFPHITRDQNRSLQYRRVRSPPVRRRQPTPRRIRHYEDDMVYEEAQAYYSQRVMEDGEVVSSLGKLPRQSTGTYDTSAARMSPRDWNENPPPSRRGHDLSPSTITGGSAYYYEDEDAMMRSRPGKSPGRRSDVYSDLTMEEDYYRYQSRGDRSQVTEDYEEKEFKYLREDQHLAVRRYPSGSSRASIGSGRRSRGAVNPVRTRMLLGEEEEEQLSPREYAERFRKIRAPEEEPPQVADNNDRELLVDQKTESEEVGDDEDENLSPRQYAEKYRKRRSAEQAEVSEKVNALIAAEDNSASFSDKQQSKSSGGSGSKKSRDSSSKRENRSSDSRRSSQGESGRKSMSVPRKDPTPRGSIDPAEAIGQYSKQNEQLPPTPRRESDSTEEQSRRSSSQVIRNQQYESRNPRDNFSFSKQELSERFEDSRAALMRQLSPHSMATDDEIREEVSSVGMASDTIRPLYENPFMKVPPPVIEDQEQDNVPLKQVQKKGSNDLEASTLSAVSGSTLSSKPSTQISGRSSQKKPTKSGSAPAIPESSSASTRSKMLWRGWKKTIGNVKKIVKDIDEQRIHPPHLSHTT